MLPLCFLIVFDTLPPIPAPADLRCPEPAVRFDLDRDFLQVEGFFGEYYGASLSGRRSGLSIDAAYDHDAIWFAGYDGRARVTFALPIEKLWLRPFLEGSWIERAGDYRRLGAGFETASDLPWFIVWSGFRYDRWSMPDLYHEGAGSVSIYGDRFPVIPQIDLTAVYRAEKWTVSSAVWLHAGFFHAGLGSPLNRDFPAPRGDFEFRTSRLILGIGIQKGLLEKSLVNYFNLDQPYRYRVPLTAEELRVGIDGRGRLQIGPFILGGNAVFYDWQTRLAPDDSLYLNPIHDLSEWRGDLFISFHKKYWQLELDQILCLGYDKTSMVIAYEPKYALTDTLKIGYGPAFAVMEIKYLHAREGIERTLPRMLLINPKIGLRRSQFEIFCAVFNLNNFREEIFEGYYPGTLKIVGGIGLKL